MRKFDSFAVILKKVHCFTCIPQVSSIKTSDSTFLTNKKLKKLLNKGVFIVVEQTLW